MLGDIEYFIRHDGKRALAFYQQSVSYFPQHEGARQGLKRLGQEPK